MNMDETQGVDLAAGADATSEGPSAVPPGLDAAEAPPSTGNPLVDAVLARTQDLDDLPVAEHVEVFESAHSALRSALQGAGDAPAPGPIPAALRPSGLGGPA